MNEPHVGAELLRFHLGASDDAEHAAVDTHLLGCSDCLTAYLTLKRTFDFATATEDRPSPAARDRLRSQVRRRLPARLARPQWMTLGAVAAAAAMALFFWTQREQSRPSQPPAAETLIDTGSDSRVAQVF